MKSSWYLVADIGGTNARFGLIDNLTINHGQVQHISTYQVADYPRFDQALQHYLQEIISSSGEHGRTVLKRYPDAACLAVAGPVNNNRVHFTNSQWVVDGQQIPSLLQGAQVTLINDFMAVGNGVGLLHPNDYLQLGGTEPVDQKPIVVLGPGTGLGVANVIPVGDHYHVIAGEGGHVDFAPITDAEIAVLKTFTEWYGRVSIERILSGDGIVNLYKALALHNNLAAPLHNASEITAAAMTKQDSLAMQTLDMFCAILGSTAGNVALTLGAQGGVYITGGIPPKIIDYLINSQFRQRFEQKGRFQSYLHSIPVRVVIRENLGLLGAGHYLFQRT